MPWRGSVKHSFGAGPPIRRERRREEAGGVELRRQLWSAYMWQLTTVVKLRKIML